MKFECVWKDCGFKCDTEENMKLHIFSYEHEAYRKIKEKRDKK